MHPGAVAVDVEALRGIGQDVGEAAATLRQAVTAAGSHLAPAPQPGSAAAAAAQKADKAWLADLQRLTGQVDGYGRSLTSAAQSYRATDQASADDLRGGGPGAGR